jgi:hypothetical protein
LAWDLRNADPQIDNIQSYDACSIVELNGSKYTLQPPGLASDLDL